MKPDELMERVAEYGGDMVGINGRFLGNTELYAVCFDGMLHEPAFESLEKAVSAGDYDAAFESAHAIKGLSGNMGLTPFYKTVCVLVESLRAKNYENVDAEYAAVAQQLDCVKKMLL